MAEERITDYRNNCVLVAIKEVTGLPDAEIFKAVRRHGYKNDHGMYQHDYHVALQELGTQLEKVKYQELIAGAPAKATSIRSLHGLTINRALRFLRHGVYLVTTRSHVLVVRDGKLVDHNYRWRSALGRTVYGVWRVLNPHMPVKTGKLRVVRQNTRRRNTRTWHAYEEAKNLIGHLEGPTRERLLAYCKIYNAIDLAWDIKRGNIVEE